MEPILSVRDLAVSFDDDPVVHGINFSLEKGDSLAVIGPNGAGKSVLLKALLRMIPFRGAIEWAKDIRVGYVPQKIDADRHLPITFRNLLAAKASSFGFSKSDVEEVRKTVALDDRILDTPVGHLSGGQFQRALIGFALLGKPHVLILDEPTASIDNAGEEQVYELIHRLQEKFGITVLLVSHDLGFVYRYANKVLCLNHSGICFGSPEEALSPSVLEKLYGGPAKFYVDADRNHHDH